MQHIANNKKTTQFNKTKNECNIYVERRFKKYIKANETFNDTLCYSGLKFIDFNVILDTLLLLLLL